jgi:hypothetical protein
MGAIGFYNIYAGLDYFLDSVMAIAYWTYQQA